MKTVRGGLVRATLAIVCVTFLVISCSVYITLGSVYRVREGKALVDTTERLSNIASGVMQNTGIEGLYYANMLRIIYEQDVEAYSKSAGYYILTVDKYNRVVLASSNAESFLAKNGIPREQINSVLEGDSTDVSGEMSFYYGQSVITAASPVYSGEEVIGAVICSLPTDYLSKLRAGTMGSMLAVLIPLLIICILASYYISFRITKPISDVSRAAKLIARGDLTQRVSRASYENEIGELAKNFNDMAAALENSDRMKNSFIADVSHELRTPMTSIIGFLQGIRDGVIPPEEQDKYIGICLEESRRLSRLVTRLLDVARLEAGETELEKVVFDINEKIRNTVFKFEDTITQKELKINADFSEGELLVFADSDGIERVLVNLIDNAVKFTPKGGIIRLITEKKGSKACITVANSGNGIPREDLQGIWDKFYKGDKSRSTDRAGTGLGLFFVKKILGSHGERITVSCEENPAEQTTYTIFKFELTEKESLQNGSKNQH